MSNVILVRHMLRKDVTYKTGNYFSAMRDVVGENFRTILLFFKSAHVCKKRTARARDNVELSDEFCMQIYQAYRYEIIYGGGEWDKKIFERGMRKASTRRRRETSSGMVSGGNEGRRQIRARRGLRPCEGRRAGFRGYSSLEREKVAYFGDLKKKTVTHIFSHFHASTYVYL